MDGVTRTSSGKSGRRGILKNVVVPPNETRKTSDVDLSGRHLERLPTSLFSSLHLTSINLSHNLLTPAAAPSSRKRLTKRRRERRRRQPNLECREGSRTRSRPPERQYEEKKSTAAEDEVTSDTLSGDSGLPPEPPDEEPHEGNQCAKGTESFRNISKEGHLNGQVKKDVPEWVTIADELQEKLRLRREKSEGKASDSVESSTTENNKENLFPAESKTTEKTVLRHISKKPKETEGSTKWKERATSSEEDDRSSSSGEESDSANESPGGGGGGGVPRGSVRAPANRSLGGLDNLKHFQQLQEVILSCNGLLEVPICLLSLPRLTCLILSHNHLQALPNALKSLTRLVELDVSHNQLVELGRGVAALTSLSLLTASHNRIKSAVELAHMETLKAVDLSGNRLSEVPGLRMVEGQDAVTFSEGELQRSSSSSMNDPRGPQGRDTDPLCLNLRLNNLTGPVTLASIQNVTELDVSDNGITSLDVSCLASLTDLTCSNNAITSLTLHAAVLVSLTASNNRLSRLEVRYHPRRLARLNLSRNELSAVPPWLVSSTEVTLVDVSHNNLTTLPAFLTSGHLRRLHTLSAHHNHLSAFMVPQRALPDQHSSHVYISTAHASSSTPYRSRSDCRDQGHSSSQNPHEEPKWCSLEVLLLHHNRLASLPNCLFTWLSRLRVLNVSANQLPALPSLEGRRGRGSPDVHDDSGPHTSLPLQELYAAANKLRDLTPLQHCRGLRILHAPYNRIASLQDRLVWSWELLEELVLSGNVLTSVPSGVSRLRRLRVLKVHSNPLRCLPRLAHLSALKVVDASHCQLGRVELEELVSPGLVALDISANTALSLDHHQFTKCKSRRPVNVVDVTSRSGRSLPLTKPHSSQPPSSRDPNYKGKTDASSKLAWTLGFAEAIGRDSKLTVGQLRVPDIASEGSVGVAALADGGQEVGCVGSLLTALPALLQEERSCSRSRTYALKYALLTALRRLRSQGAPLPVAVCAAHLELEGAMDSSRCQVLRICCYGSVSAAVTTTHGEPIFVTTSSPRTQQTCTNTCEDGVKCVLGEAATLPDPHTTELHLGPHHTGVVIGSASFWEVIGTDEVTTVCSEMNDPGKAAKRLLDLAQGYGTRQALSVIVIRLLPIHSQLQNKPPVERVSQTLSSKSNSVSVECLTEDAIQHLGHCVDEDTQTHRVHFSRKPAVVDVSTSTAENDEHRRKVRVNSHGKKSASSPLRNDANKNRVVSAMTKNKSRSERNLVQSIEDLDRSSPSGQSQSDHSEHDSDVLKHSARSKSQESLLSPKPRPTRPNIEDLYAKPNRRKRETGSKPDLASKTDSIKINGQQSVTYYHYPRPDPLQPSPQNHLASHLLNMTRTEFDDGVLAPPAGFADTGSDSEDSDSGLSGVSGGHLNSHMKHAHSEDNILENDHEQVTEEQFRSWEYLLARNAKLLFMRELDTLTRSNSRNSPLPTASAPDIVMATAAEADENTHFQRNAVRKSRLGRGTFRMIQNKLSATTSKFSTLQRFRSNSSKNESNFHRFGSLQNLKYYQQNRPRPPHYQLVQPDLATEMQERSALDSLELETRMHHYWHTGVTNF